MSRRRNRHFKQRQSDRIDYEILREQARLELESHRLTHQNNEGISRLENELATQSTGAIFNPNENGRGAHE